MTDRQIFLNAPADASPEVLAAYLEKACDGDEHLRQRVEALIASDAEAGSVLEAGVLGDATLLDDAPLAEGPGDVIGNYKLLQQIGEGGFGVVYMAEQLRPVKRSVAFKIIKLGMDTRQVVARFEAERQALAMMDHPNIAKVLDAGATDTGRPFFVMELVRGIPITRFCDDQNLSTRERLELFIDVCHAVQHAHQKGVIQIATSSTRRALDTAELERQALEMEMQAKAIRKEQRSLTWNAVGLGQWKVARNYVREFLDNPQDESFAGIGAFDSKGIQSLDRIKLAALHLALGDHAALDEVCAWMHEDLDRSNPGPPAERAVRAYFSIPRSPDDSRARDLLEIARQVAMPDGHSYWEGTCRGIAEYRMENYEAARQALADILKAPNLKAQVLIRPYLAMTCHHLGDSANAQKYLREAGNILAKLEAKKIDYFWHERLIGRLALEEARALIGEP